MGPLNNASNNYIHILFIQTITSHHTTHEWYQEVCTSVRERVCVWVCLCHREKCSFYCCCYCLSKRSRTDPRTFLLLKSCASLQKIPSMFCYKTFLLHNSSDWCCSVQCACFEPDFFHWLMINLFLFHFLFFVWWLVDPFILLQKAHW